MHTKLEKVKIANALQLEGCPTSRQSFQFCTAHAQKLLFTDFRSKFWHRHQIQQHRFPKKEQKFGDQTTFSPC